MMLMNHAASSAATISGIAAIAAPFSRTPFGGVARGVTPAFRAAAAA
ncbi:hypothetical protein [Microbacterium rhizomatis]|nr:hypothetical protein [Microbacterium rhizomatis]